MTAVVSLSNDGRTPAGILLLTIIALECGGLTMLRIVCSHLPATEFQRSFARAGHARGPLRRLCTGRSILAEGAELSGAANFPCPGLA